MNCIADGCDRPIRYHTVKLCNRHYLRMRRHGDPNKGRLLNGKTIEYLHWSINNAQIDECQIWPYRTDQNGYARINVSKNGKRLDMLVHRMICEMVHGPQPSEEKCVVAHSCGKGSSGCVNHFHLRWATYKENEGDKLLHDTHNRGEKSGRHKLTETEVKLIRYFCDSGLMSHSQLSKTFKISEGQISRIRNRIDWSWLA